MAPIFAAAAGFVAQAVADNFPGAPALDEAELTAIFVAVATSVVAIAWKWLEGWQKFEEQEFAREAFPIDNAVVETPDAGTQPRRSASKSSTTGKA